MSLRTFFAIALCVTSATQAFARPGDRVFTVIDQHNATRLLQAARSGEDSLKNGGREAQILLSGRGLLLTVPGFTNVQKDVMAIKRRNARLRIIACKETVDILTKANRRPPPMIPGVNVEACKGRIRHMESAGWQRMLGI
jgi:hypothetical protein